MNRYGVLRTSRKIHDQIAVLSARLEISTRVDDFGGRMDFVSLSLNYWEDLWQSRHQITLALAQDHKVLFVSPPFSIREVFGHFLRKNRLPKSGIIHRRENLYTLVFPKWLFVTYRFPRLARLTTSLRERLVRRGMRKLGFKDTVLLIWYPSYVDLVGAFGEEVCCYYVDDEFAGYAEKAEAQRQQIIRQEDELLKRADLVFANGSALLNAKNRYGNAISVPMTADFELFSRSRLPETPVPEDLESVPHPRIGYIGNLNDKVDFQLLLQLSIARPQWSFVLVGPTNIRNGECKNNFERLRSEPNVYVLGSKTRESLPNYIKGLDVCVMCYRKVGWALYVYPLKLHEYLASGKPVVGTSLPSMSEFTEVVQVADTPQEWLEALQTAIADKDQARAQKRIQTAYENRLDVRIATIKKAIEEKIREKSLPSTR